MLSEKAIETINYLNELYLDDTPFTYKDCFLSSAILTSLCKQKYIEIANPYSTPIQYKNLHKKIPQEDISKPKKKKESSNSKINGKRPWTTEARKLIGKQFGGTWTVESMYGNYKEDYIEAVKKLYDVTIDCNNGQYWCYNSFCGTKAVIEKTTINRNIDRDCLKTCRGCDGSKKGNLELCHYATPIRYKPLTKKPDREQKVFIGKTYNNFKVLSIKPSGNYSDHQCRAEIECIHCGRTKESRFDALLLGAVTCECFRNRSAGEMLIEKYLTDNNIPHKSEQTFKDLIGTGSGLLRYDFAILKDNQIIQFIEFDGIQHKEIGHFNEDGKVFIHDDIKDKYAKEHNIPLLRIPYIEINNINNILDKELKK